LSKITSEQLEAALRWFKFHGVYKTICKFAHWKKFFERREAKKKANSTY
jgi:hypothetical protein